MLKVEAARTAPAPSLAGLTAWDKIIVTSVLHDNSNDSDKDNYNDKYLFDDDYHILPDGARAELVDEICLSLQCSILRRNCIMSRHAMSCHVMRCDLSDVGSHAPHYRRQPQQPVVVQELQGVLRSTQLYTCHVLTRHGMAATRPTWKVSTLSEHLSSQPTVSTQGTPPPLSRCS